MARYVVVEFDNDDEAEGFVSGVGVDGAHMRIAGMYKKPTVFCKCPVVGHPSEQKSVLGQKNNWRVCAICKRPREGVWQHPRNMLLPEEKPAKRRWMFTSIEPRPTQSE